MLERFGGLKAGASFAVGSSDMDDLVVALLGVADELAQFVHGVESHLRARNGLLILGRPPSEDRIKEVCVLHVQFAFHEEE